MIYDERFAVRILACFVTQLAKSSAVLGLMLLDVFHIAPPFRICLGDVR